MRLGDAETWLVCFNIGNQETESKDNMEGNPGESEKSVLTGDGSSDTTHHSDGEELAQESRENCPPDPIINSLGSRLVLDLFGSSPFARKDPFSAP